MAATLRSRRRKRNTAPLFQRVKEGRQRASLNFRRRRKKLELSKVRPVLFFIIQTAAVVFAAYLVVSMFGIRGEVIGESMEPTLVDGDEVLFNKLSYRLSAPNAGDMIAFYPNGNTSANISIKRIIAVPGDTVRIENGAVYVDDVLFEDVGKTDYISEAGLAADGITVKAGEYFCLGDNRNNSEDSRFASVGNVGEDMIVGKIWLRVTPGNIGLVQ